MVIEANAKAAALGVAAVEGVTAELGVDAGEGVAAPDGAAEELPVELPVAAALGVAAGEGAAAELSVAAVRARPRRTAGQRSCPSSCPRRPRWASQQVRVWPPSGRRRR